MPKLIRFVLKKNYSIDLIFHYMRVTHKRTMSSMKCRSRYHAYNFMWLKINILISLNIKAVYA